MVQGVSLADQSMRTGFQATIRIALVSSIIGWIGLAAAIVEGTGLVGYTQILDLMSRFKFGFVVSVALALLVYLALRSGKPAVEVSPSSEEQPDKHDRQTGDLKSDVAVVRSDASASVAASVPRPVRPP